MKVIYQYFVEKINVLQRLIQELYDEIARCQQNNFRLKSNLNDLRKRLLDKDLEIERLNHDLKYQKKELRRVRENLTDLNNNLGSKIVYLNDRIFHAKVQKEGLLFDLQSKDLIIKELKKKLRSDY